MDIISKMETAVRRPDIVTHRLARRKRGVLSKFPHDVGIQGSYWTGNVGDRAIGEAIQAECKRRGKSSRLYDKHRESANAPIRLLGGGGVLHDWYGTKHLEERLNFIANGGSAIGVGVPGFQTDRGRELIADAADDIDVFTVRDARSQEQIEEVCGVSPKVTACPAFLHDDPNERSKGYTGINFRPWFMDDEALDADDLVYYFDYPKDLTFGEAREAYLNQTQRICDLVEDPKFIPFRKKDEEFARKHLDIDVFEMDLNVTNTLQRVSSADQMVAMRFHSLIFSAITRTPVAALAYEPKVGLLADRLGVESRRPNGHLELDFREPENVDELNELAKENFELLFR